MLDLRRRGSVSRHRRRDGSIAYRVRIPIAGREVSCGIYETEADADAALAAALAELGNAPRDHTLRTWGVDWLEARETDGYHRGVTEERSVWRRHVLAAHFADWPLRRIKRSDVVRWLDQLSRTRATRTAAGGRRRSHARAETDRLLSTSTLRSALSLLRGALRAAADRGHLDADPTGGVRVPRRARDHEGWTWLREHEIETVLALDLRPEQRAIYTVAIYTGLRAGELWGLRWCDVELTGSRPGLHVRRSYRGPTKPGRVRWLPLLPPALEALQRWHRERPGIGEALVWPAHGGGCHASGYDAGWPRIVRLAQLGRRVRLHDLRHTCASHLVQGTWTPAPLTMAQVCKWLGHSSVLVTERYAHMSPDYLASIPDTGPTPDTAQVGDEQD